MTGDAAIETRDLTVCFGRGAAAARAVDAVSFRVRRGEAYGLIGESGSGKSTVLRAISGLNLAYDGEIRVDGAAAPKPRDKAFWRRVQMVFQDPYGSLHPRKLVRTTLLEPLEIHGIGDREDRLRAALDDVGLDADFAHRYPHQLSGGQRQRVAIARCIILEPEFLLLDEPTSALDVSVQAGVLNLLQALRLARGLTYVMVSHDLSVIAHMCEHAAVMTQGRIVEEVSTDLLRAGADACQHAYTRELIASSQHTDTQSRLESGMSSLNAAR